MSLQAVLGIHQLQRVAADWQLPSEIWNKYQESFSALEIGRTAEYEADAHHVRHGYTIGIDKEQCGIEHDAFIELMRRVLSSASRPHYQEQFGWRSDDHPVADTAGTTRDSLTLAANLTDEQVERAIEVVERLLVR